MKKYVPFLAIIGMLLIPWLVRLSVPSLYLFIKQQYPVLGVALLMALDIFWLWLTLFTVMLIGWAVSRRRVRSQLKDVS